MTRQPSVNPAKSKVQPKDSPSAAFPPPPAPGGLGARLGTVLLSFVCVALLNLSFPPFDNWFLAYAALTPWLVLCAMPGRWAAMWCWLTGLLFWATSLYWLTWITLPGYGALTAYLSLYWLVALLVVRAAMRHGWPAWVVLPVVWVGLEFARSWVISGFTWFSLAHSQYAQVRLIQVADITGEYGVSYFVAMANGAIFDAGLALWRWRRSGNRQDLARRWIGLAATVGALAALLAYGSWRLAEETRSEGPVIGIVQRAFPISLSEPGATAAELFDAHRRATAEQLTNGKCDLVVWPETMLPKGLNPEFLNMEFAKLPLRELRQLCERFYILDSAESYAAGELVLALANKVEGRKEPESQGQKNQPGLREYARAVSDLSRKLRCPILAGGATIHRNIAPVDSTDHWLVRNSAMLFDGSPDCVGLYSKMHLVPFSEYVPFKGTWAHRMLRSCVPPVMEQLDAGSPDVPFSITARGKTWRLATPICYEGAFARVCRELVGGSQKPDNMILVNLSNDGWFNYPWGGSVYQGSTEQSQHLSQYVFRAIENRVPVVRAVNTGISGSIDSNGRIMATVSRYGHTTMVEGTLLLDGDGPSGEDSAHGPKVLVDSRMTVYSSTGDAFAQLVGLAGAAMIVMLLWKRYVAKPVEIR